MKLGNEWLYARNKGCYLIFSTIKRVLNRDKQYIEKHASLEWNPYFYFIEKKGNKNVGKIIYNIHEIGNGYGFFAELRNLLEKLLYVDMKGFTPSVVFGTNYLYYDKDLEGEQPNAFEYYFEAIGGIEDSNNSFNVIEEKKCYYLNLQEYWLGDSKIFMDFDEAMGMMIKKYIHIRQELLEEMINDYKELFPKGKILGIHYRGSDYKMGYNTHPVIVRVDQIMKVIDTVKKDFDYIFLATDEEGVFEKFQNKYGNIVKCFPDVKRTKGTVSVAFSEDTRKKHHYLLGK